jgi:amino acid adenylation domain-containing protein
MHKEVAVDKPFGPLTGSLLHHRERGSLEPGTRDPALIPRCVPQLVASQSLASPDHVAIATAAETISYRELDLRSTHLAMQLRVLGVRPDVVVAICLDRSVSFVVAALAVWKAGGAYLPVDISSPAERVNFILKDAQVPVVLTQKALATPFAVGPWKIIDVDWELNFTQASNGNFRDARISPENLAYIIYTSGSTGQPKGVEITHKGLFNLVTWHTSAFEITPFDRATQLSNLGFDAGVWELWPYLAAGASVHIADDETRLSPDRLQSWFAKEKITASFVSAPLAERLLPLEWPTETSIRLLLTGADTLLQYPRPGLPFRLINNYGPTECTVVATSACIRPDSHSPHPPSIGRPIQNVKIRLLDPDRREVQVGAVGEIYIAGVSLARGYRNAPELTREKFISDPFSKDPTARLFKTGDLARLRPDGQLEFLGRIDDQVKIRGHRIEPNEVITVLRRHRAVAACTVVAKKSIAAERRLIAYIVAVPASKVSASDLRAHLAKHLPDYMLPETFVLLPALPLNSSGKVDRLALPLPNASNTLPNAGFLGPRTPIEKRLAEILEGLLDIQHVGVEDNFFLLGGHSLLGTQLIARVQETFGIEVSLRALFDSPTIAELSVHIERLILARLEAMSEEEAQRILSAQADPA